jgi:hypothetical protein
VTSASARRRAIATTPAGVRLRPSSAITVIGAACQ